MSLCKKYKLVLFFLFLQYVYGQGLFAQEKKKDCCSARIDSMLKILPTQKEDSNKVRTLLDIAWDKFNFTWSVGGDYESAIAYAQQGLALTNKVNFKWGKGRANFVLGKCYEEKADYAEALKYNLRGLKIAFENGNKILALNEYYHTGRIYNRMANYKEAFKNLFASYQLAKEIKEEGWFSDIHATIGTVYYNQGNFYKAEKYYNEAWGMAEKRQEKSMMINILTYKGNLALSKGLYDDALQKFFSALKILEQRPVKSHIAGNYYVTAKTYLKKDSASKDSFIIKKNCNEAIAYLSKSLTIYKEIGVKEAIIRCYLLLSEAYRGINDYKNALVYSDLYFQTGDSVFNKAAYVKIAELKVQYETEKAAVTFKLEQEKEKVWNAKLFANQEIEQEKKIAEQKLTQQKEMAEAKAASDKLMASEKARQEKIVAQKQRTNNLLLMGFTMVVVISVFSILLIRQKNQKKRAIEKAEALHKMSELELQSLRAQLNPHFMFNSLNSIQALILKEENEKSQSYLSRFAKLLRLLLENADKPFIPLCKEIDFLKLYLSLETLRVPELQYSIFTDPVLNTDEILIPNMILQPYVENAIWHGLSYKEGDKQLQIRINRVNGIVQYEIEDNGVGRKKSEEMKSLFRKQNQSKGMELLNKRFKLLSAEYNSKIQTSITDVIKDNEVAGTLVILQVPVELYSNFKTNS